jgi:hypothetical protein
LGHTVYEQRERVFHRDIQTRENNVWVVYMVSQMNRDVTECFRLLIWIEFLTNNNLSNLHAWLRYLIKTLVTFIKFHRVIQMASCDQIGDYHWLNCSWIINEFEKKQSRAYRVIYISRTILIASCFALRFDDYTRLEIRLRRCL